MAKWTGFVGLFDTCQCCLTLCEISLKLGRYQQNTAKHSCLLNSSPGLRSLVALSFGYPTAASEKRQNRVPSQPTTASVDCFRFRDPSDSRKLGRICSTSSFFPRGMECSPLVVTPPDYLSRSGAVEGGGAPCIQCLIILDLINPPNGFSIKV